MVIVVAGGIALAFVAALTDYAMRSNDLPTSWKAFIMHLAILVAFVCGLIVAQGVDR